MAAPEGHKQITLFIDENVLKEVDEAARSAYGRNNARTAWITEAIREKLARDGELTDGVGDEASANRVKEIVNAYTAMNETGKEWLHMTAVIARNADDFK